MLKIIAISVAVVIFGVIALVAFVSYEVDKLETDL